MKKGSGSLTLVCLANHSLIPASPCSHPCNTSPIVHTPQHTLKVKPQLGQSPVSISSSQSSSFPADTSYLVIDSTDIIDSRIKLILGLIWTLILHYSITMPLWDDEPDFGGYGKCALIRLGQSYTRIRPFLYCN